MQDAEAAVPVRYESRAWCWCMCLGLALMLTGVLIGGVYLYHFYTLDSRAGSHHGWGVGRKLDWTGRTDLDHWVLSELVSEASALWWTIC